MQHTHPLPVSLRRLARAGVVAALCALPSRAQSFNLDVGDNLVLFPAPSDVYGAGAGQAGRWNTVVPPFDVDLVDLFGNATSVHVTSDVTNSVNDFQTSLTGDDEDFMEDAQHVPNLGAVARWTFTNLAPGDYRVYTYCWEQTGAVLTDVEVLGSPDPVQTVGGPWGGSPHVEGTTHAVHTVAVGADGTLEVELVGSPLGDSGACNGFQLVSLGELGSAYCIGAPNSAGPGAVIVAEGSAGVADNDLTLVAAGAPAGVPGIFFFGPNPIQVPFGDGFRCVGGQVQRLFPPQATDAGGEARRVLDLAASPAAGVVIPGSTQRFQFWFRDGAAGMAGFNLTNGREIAFQ